MGIFITYTNIIKFTFHLRLHYSLVSLIILINVWNGLYYCLSKFVFTTYLWSMPWKNPTCGKKIIKLFTWFTNMIQIMCNHMWNRYDEFGVFFEYWGFFVNFFTLTKIVTIQNLGNVEHQSTFSTLSFIASKWRN